MFLNRSFFWTTVILIVLTQINGKIVQGSRKGKFLLAYHLHNGENRDNSYYEKPSLPEETFDFIIVGSGPAGSVLANRLTENPEWKVLLIEVGDEANSLTDIPYMAEFFQLTNYNWGYSAEQQNTSCNGCSDKRLRMPSGRALGGSSVTDFMLYARGNAEDFDKWKEMGNNGWSYDNVLRYFKKSEEANLNMSDTDYHQKGGLLSVSDVPYRTESANVFVKAAQEAGLTFLDYNGKQQNGVSYVQTTTKSGKRVSAEKAFLRPIRHRTNLKIIKNSRVIKILISPETKQAHGVQYIRNKQYWQASIKREIILSAGTFNSPQLLMLSGIGPKRHLENLGISLIKDLPVGKKLYDHVLFPGLSFILNNETIVPNQEKETGKLDNYIDIRDGKGAFTVPMGGMEAVAFLNTESTSLSEKANPDIELISFGGGISGDKNLAYRELFGISKEVYNTVWKPLEGKPILQILPVLLHPKSSGYLKLKTSNPYHWPKIYTNFLTDENNQDARTLLAGIREAQRIVTKPAFQKYDAKIVGIPIPGCENYTFNSDDYWLCSLRQLSTTLGDPTSTCKMGPLTDPEAIVDSKLRVHGIHNLRIADASIMPTSISGHISTVGYMIGEKAADLIKNTWKKRS